MLEIAIWLSETKWSIARHESLYMYPWIESAHVLSICFFIGILLFVDLRLMGVAFTKLPISEMNKKVLPWSLFGFSLMALTGFLLFYAIPVTKFCSLLYLSTTHGFNFRENSMLTVTNIYNIWI